MSLPLNIDFQQIFLHFLNFVILAFGLYFLLYKPVKDFMDKREKYYKDLDNEANSKNSEADKLLDEYKNKLASADKDIEDKKESVLKQASIESQETIDKAKKDAEQIIEDAKASAKKKHDEIVNSANKDITDLAIKATSKLVDKSIDASYDDFLKALKKKD